MEKQIIENIIGTIATFFSIIYYIPQIIIYYFIL